MQLTDKQYKRIIRFQGRKVQALKKAPDQFDLFG